MLPPNPYYPLGVEIVGYVPNVWGAFHLVALFAAVCCTVLGVTYGVVKRVRPRIATSELCTVLWFVLCGCIHLILEGYYAYNFQDIGAHQHILGQLWKEYSLSDSRYLTRDAFVFCMETVTAVFWGPLSFALAVFITLESPFRHVLQTVISLGQLYGNVLYYGIAFFGHAVYRQSYSRPENYYFWGYFMFLNAFWIVIPCLLLYQSTRAISKAFRMVQTGKRKKVA